MKLLLVFAFLALICMARSAPTPSTTPRELILPDYHEDDEDTVHDGNKVHDDETHIDVDAEEEDEDTTTTTTTPFRRSSYAIPTRNRNLIPSRRPILNQRTTSVRTTTTTVADDEEHSENGNEYDGDFKYIRDFRKYIQKLMEDIRKLVQNLTGYNFNKKQQQQQQYNQYDEDE